MFSVPLQIPSAFEMNDLSIESSASECQAANTKDHIDLSIIIVSWNTKEVLQECLESTFSGLVDCNAEVIVVDNGSNDGSPMMVAKEFPAAKLIANTENLGFAAANNQAIRVARGRYILLLNSDTIVLGDVLRESVRYLKEHEEVGVLGCRVLNTDGSVQLTCSRLPSLLNLTLLASGLFRLSQPAFFGRYQLRGWQRDSERDVETVTGCYMMLRREAIQQVGLMDESFFFYGEETDWCKRFQQAGWKLRFAPVGEIIHHGSLSSRKCNHRRDVMLTSGLLRYQRKHGGFLHALVAWNILAIFCLLRSGYWTLYAILRGDVFARQRRDHFLKVLGDFRNVWPSYAEVE